MLQTWRSAGGLSARNSNGPIRLMSGGRQRHWPHNNSLEPTPRSGALRSDQLISIISKRNQSIRRGGSAQSRWAAHTHGAGKGNMDMKVLIVLCDGFVEYEYAIPLMALHYHQVPFEVVGLSRTEITGMTGLKAITTKTVSEVNTDRYVALLLPGIDRDKRDHALRDERLLTLVRDFDRAGKLIAAVCAAPVILGTAGVLRGRQFCSEVQNHPAFTGAIRSSGPAVRDGHVVTGLGSRIFQVHGTARRDIGGPRER